MRRHTQARAHTHTLSHTYTYIHTLQLAAEHIAAGAFQTAMSLLHRQLGLANFEPMRPLFMDLYTASHAVMPGLAGLPSVLSHIDA
jgi:coatomer protein complex subunit alpha (xenin)